MFKLLMQIPKQVFVATSGGADSMAVLDFLKRSHDVVVLHFNHGTVFGNKAAPFLDSYLKSVGIPAIFGQISCDIPKGKSKEAFWREERYAFFNSVAANCPIILAHNLDDAVETWIFSSLHGKPQLIPACRSNYMRPFLTTRKSALREWCGRKGVPFMDDPGNEDLSHPRIRIRKDIIPHVEKINPGIYKVLTKKYMAGETTI